MFISSIFKSHIFIYLPAGLHNCTINCILSFTVIYIYICFTICIIKFESTLSVLFVLLVKKSQKYFPQNFTTLTLKQDFVIDNNICDLYGLNIAVNEVEPVWPITLAGGFIRKYRWYTPNAYVFVTAL